MLGGGRAKLAALEATLSARIAEAEERLARAEAAAQEMAKHAYLLGITREGRSNKFVFVRNGEMFEIETMGLLSDDVQQWRKDLLE